MTVKELRDKLDAYIKKDPPDTWQLNDCTLDKLYYDERCEERANRQVMICDDGMSPKYFNIEFSGGMENNYILFCDLTNDIEISSAHIS